MAVSDLMVELNERKELSMSKCASKESYLTYPIRASVYGTFSAAPAC